MTPYYEGTSEAEHLSRGSPELVEPWLKKAKQDRSRLTIRLFQPQRKEFLDGFINSLEGFLAHQASRKAAAGHAPEVPVDLPDAGGLDAGAASSPTDVAPAGERDQAQFGDEVSAPGTEVQGERSARLGEPGVTVETVGPHQQPEAEADHAQSDTEAEEASGIMRLSGWSIDVDPSENDSGADEVATANQLVDPSVQTGEPVQSVPWSRVFEQARGVGMVDLSAYDFIDGLGELRDLIDHWQQLHDDAGSVDPPAS